MADSKGGPVKPPVIDLSAREASAASGEKDIKSNPEKPASASDTKSASGPAAKSARAPETKTAAPVAASTAPSATGAKPRPGAHSTSEKTSQTEPAPTAAPSGGGRGGLAVGAALAGAVLGLAAAYGLAWAGYWPTPVAKPDPRLAQYDQVLPELRNEAQSAQSAVAGLVERVAALESAEPMQAVPAGGQGDSPSAIADLQTEIEALKTQIAAQPASGESSAALDLSGIRDDLAQFRLNLGELSARIGTAESGLDQLDKSVAANSEAVSKQPNDINAVLQLPLILSGLETAFASGRPYETELNALRAGLPDATVPTEIANGAVGGLTRGDVIEAQFAAVLPNILAGRPANPDASWQDSTLDWFRSAIALRPTEAMEGDNPEAVVSRLNAAIGRRDFVEADTLFAQLPAPMRAAAGDVPVMVKAQAAASLFLDGLRQQALSEVAP
ncbi:hypothetical protein PSQ90_08410 [Devosia rhodophyticola]|uniref:Uncharacterized protein n=1 Tax=Devosia rhodophyticola TaxID=3026423 RepID=A0ABY7Z1L3_9HYPH|nr:hypothetical protein [Devosia rhodophyticola]WDR07426.1 hypothetical protein PSQ90_08410 [Devosia rhodophyticola]